MKKYSLTEDTYFVINKTDSRSNYNLFVSVYEYTDGINPLYGTTFNDKSSLEDIRKSLLAKNIRRSIF